MTHAHPHALPRSVAWLGYGGLLPFVMLTAASPLDPAHAALWQHALLAYGAIILSFVGALHWGLAMSLPDPGAQRSPAWFAWSVVPALIAWLALLLTPAPAAALLAGGFLAHLLQDRRLARQSSLPGWYLPLRLRLSSVAVLCLLTNFILQTL